ncbi:MAG TPA: hypothetical protein VFS47_05405 [Steroidobacteraceae bacterium]|nr:hypothetical protein [Steroidobacteraceae bacterium]
MEAERPTSLHLLLSWVCVIGAIALIGAYGNTGWLAALLPMGIAMRIRQAHDKELFDRLRESGLWQRIAIVYYGALLIVVLVALSQGTRVDQYPFFVEAIVLLFPGFVCMAWNDLSAFKVRAGR